MQQAERSERSRQQILEAALRLFSSQGYRGTSIRDIADAAGVSTGNLYHQFSDKETIFDTLLDQYWKKIAAPEFPFNQVLAQSVFPDNIEALGRAARDSVSLYKRHVALVYVDVVEFEGRHIRRFYSEMAQRFHAVWERHPDRRRLEAKLRPGISPVSAVMLASRFLLHFFSVEIVFGVRNHFGKDSEAVVHEIADILRHGMLKPETKARKPARRAASVRKRAVARRG